MSASDWSIVSVVSRSWLIAASRLTEPWPPAASAGVICVSTATPRVRSAMVSSRRVMRSRRVRGQVGIDRVVELFGAGLRLGGLAGLQQRQVLLDRRVHVRLVALDRALHGRPER